MGIFAPLVTGATTGREAQLSKEQDDMKEREKYIWETMQAMSEHVENSRELAQEYNSRFAEAKNGGAPEQLADMYANNPTMKFEDLANYHITNAKVQQALSTQSTKVSTPTSVSSLQQSSQAVSNPTASGSAGGMANGTPGQQVPGTTAANGPTPVSAGTDSSLTQNTPTSVAAAGGVNPDRPQAPTGPQAPPSVGGIAPPPSDVESPATAGPATVAAPIGGGVTAPLNPSATMSFTDKMLGRIPNDVKNNIIFGRVAATLGKTPQEIQSLLNAEMTGDYGFRKPIPAALPAGQTLAYTPNVEKMMPEVNAFLDRSKFPTQEARSGAATLYQEGIQNNDPTKISIAEGMAMSDPQQMAMRVTENSELQKSTKRLGPNDVYKIATATAATNLGGAVTYGPNNEMNYNFTATSTGSNSGMLNAAYNMLVNKSAQDGQRMTIKVYGDANNIQDAAVLSRATALALAANIDLYGRNNTKMDPMIAKDLQAKHQQIVQQYGFTQEQQDQAIVDMTNPENEAPSRRPPRSKK